VDWDKLIPWMESEEIRIHANAFLVEHNPEGVLPLPIEEIVEFKLGINIVRSTVCRHELKPLDSSPAT